MQQLQRAESSTFMSSSDAKELAEKEKTGRDERSNVECSSLSPESDCSGCFSPSSQNNDQLQHHNPHQQQSMSSTAILVAVNGKTVKRKGRFNIVPEEVVTSMAIPQPGRISRVTSMEGLVGIHSGPNSPRSNVKSVSLPETDDQQTVSSVITEATQMMPPPPPVPQSGAKKKGRFVLTTASDTDVTTTPRVAIPLHQTILLTTNIPSDVREHLRTERSLQSPPEGSPSRLGKVLHFLDQMRVEVTDADRTIRDLQNDLKFLRDRNKDLEKSNFDLEKRCHMELTMRAESDAKLFAVEKQFRDYRTVMERKIQEFEDRPVNALPPASMIEMEDGGSSPSFDDVSFDNSSSLISKQGESGNSTPIQDAHLSHLMNCSTTPRKRNGTHPSRSENNSLTASNNTLVAIHPPPSVLSVINSIPPVNISAENQSLRPVSQPTILPLKVPITITTPVTLSSSIVKLESPENRPSTDDNSAEKPSPIPKSDNCADSVNSGEQPSNTNNTSTPIHTTVNNTKPSHTVHSPPPMNNISHSNVMTVRTGMQIHPPQQYPQHPQYSHIQTPSWPPSSLAIPHAISSYPYTGATQPVATNQKMDPFEVFALQRSASNHSSMNLGAASGNGL